MIERVLVAWCPDWPIIAVAGSDPAPIALIEHGAVYAVSASGRAEGVRRGLRLREAQARCPGLRVQPYRAEQDVRAYEPVISALEEVVPEMQVLRPGVCAIRARGPAAFYGGEEEAALWLLDCLDAAGAPGSRIGVADGVFSAEQAARAARPQRIRIIPEGESAEFLSALPIALLDDADLVTLLSRLGIRTLGDFAALPPESVQDRFGPQGARLHALAGGWDSRRVVPRVPPEDFAVSIDFEPPLDRVDQVAFAVRNRADAFVEQLTGALLVCTALRIELIAEHGEHSERVWLHPRSFTASEVVDRVRWQLQGGERESGLHAPVSTVRLTPHAVDAIAHHEQGLWGTVAGERIHHALSRVQSILGRSAVLTAAIGGGRAPSDRARLTPWGERLLHTRHPDEPWPGRLPEPAPTTVYATPRPVRVLGAGGETVEVDARGRLSENPAVLSGVSSTLRVMAWAGPWTVNERWWDPDAARVEHRIQAVDTTGHAWLLLRQHDQWWIEAGWD